MNYAARKIYLNKAGAIFYLFLMEACSEKISMETEKRLIDWQASLLADRVTKRELTRGFSLQRFLSGLSSSPENSHFLEVKERGKGSVHSNRCMKARMFPKFSEISTQFSFSSPRDIICHKQYVFVTVTTIYFFFLQSTNFHLLGSGKLERFT